MVDMTKRLETFEKLCNSKPGAYFSFIELKRELGLTEQTLEEFLYEVEKQEKLSIMTGSIGLPIYTTKKGVDKSAKKTRKTKSK